MEPNADLQTLLDRLPGRAGSKLTEVAEGAAATVREIHALGRDAVAALAGMLVAPGEGDDVKPRYALHALATYAAGLDDAPRKEFASAVAGELEADRPPEVRIFLVRQLQVAGGGEVAAGLARLLRDEELCEPAAQALVAIRSGAAEQFRAALPDAKGRRRLVIVQSLGVLADAAAAPQLRKALDDEDGDTRLAAAWALANIGDPAAVDAVLKLAEAGGYARIDATRSCLLLAERLAAAGRRDDARRIYAHLRQTRTEPSEAYVRNAAEKSLAALR